MKHLVGLDVSLEETSICVIDENGTVIKEGKAPTDLDAITQWVPLLDLVFERVGLEAGPHEAEIGGYVRNAG